jgi:hypothetical protein
MKESTNALKYARYLLYSLLLYPVAGLCADDAGLGHD